MFYEFHCVAYTSIYTWAIRLVYIFSLQLIAVMKASFCQTEASVVTMAPLTAGRDVHINTP